MKKRTFLKKFEFRRETLHELAPVGLLNVRGGEHERRSDVSNNCCDPNQGSS